jgi:hypothetical protein
MQSHRPHLALNLSPLWRIRTGKAESVSGWAGSATGRKRRHQELEEEAMEVKKKGRKKEDEEEWRREHGSHRRHNYHVENGGDRRETVVALCPLPRLGQCGVSNNMLKLRFFSRMPFSHAQRFPLFTETNFQ